MAKKTTKSFRVSAVVKVWTEVGIDAENLEDAVAQSRELSVTDFIKITDEHVDSALRITGVQDSDWESIDGST